MATTNKTTASDWERQTRILRSALDLANSAAGQIAGWVLYLEANYDSAFMLPDDLALVYDYVVHDSTVEAQVILDFPEAGQEAERLAGLWRPFSESPEWDCTVGSTVAVLRGDHFSDLVCGVRLAHYMSQAAILAARTSMQGDAV